MHFNLIEVINILLDLSVQINLLSKGPGLPDSREQSMQKKNTSAQKAKPGKVMLIN